MQCPKPTAKKGRHKMTNACDISQKVKAIVRERDGGNCVTCGNNQGIPNAHYIARSHGGLGIEQNIVCLCPACHHLYDNGDKKEEYGERIRDYLMEHYPNWNEEELIYNKYDI